MEQGFPRGMTLSTMASSGGAAASASEASETAEADDADIAEWSTKRRCNLRRRHIVGTCILLFAVVVASLLAVFWPKTPTWKVQELRVEPEALSEMISAFTDPTYNKTAEFEVNTSIAFFNPNLAGATTSAGNFDVTFDGLPISTAVSAPMQVPAHGHAVAEVLAKTRMAPATIDAIRSKLMPSFKMDVHVDGHMPVKTILGLHLTIHIVCTIHLNTLVMVSSPKDIVTGYECNYGI